LQHFQSNEVFSLDKFRDYTLNKSQEAARRESITNHQLEHLKDGDKGIFYISNYLGGIYHLTADEIYKQNNTLIIQESKNASKSKLPSEDDIKDGLFKLILFNNLDYLCLGNERLEFITCLKITGQIIGTLKLPIYDSSVLEDFCKSNRLSKHKTRLIKLLNQEAIQNRKLNILITNND
jgi:hypothetical protein